MGITQLLEEESIPDIFDNNESEYYPISAFNLLYTWDLIKDYVDSDMSEDEMDRDDLNERMGEERVKLEACLTTYVDLTEQVWERIGTMEAWE